MQDLRTPLDVAHELRTPLTALRLHLEEALMYPDDADPSVALRKAMRYVTRLEKTVTDLLSSGRIYSPQGSPFHDGPA